VPFCWEPRTERLASLARNLELVGSTTTPRGHDLKKKKKAKTRGLDAGEEFTSVESLSRKKAKPKKTTGKGSEENPLFLRSRLLTFSGKCGEKAGKILYLQGQRKNQNCSMTTRKRREESRNQSTQENKKKLKKRKKRSVPR